jgi:putative hydrolase of the HAD superfamily
MIADTSMEASASDSIRVISFDAANTLIHLREPVGATYAAVARRFGLNLDPALLTKAFGAAWRVVPPPATTQGPRPDDGRSWWATMVQATMRGAGYTIPEFATYFAALYEEFTRSGVWYLERGTKQLLSDLLGAGYRLGVLSNFDRRLHAILDQLEIGELFEHVVISSEIGADKPDPRIFAELIRRFRVLPEQVLHVGDDPRVDGAAARAAGLRALVVGQTGKNLSDLRQTLGLP